MEEVRLFVGAKCLTRDGMVVHILRVEPNDAYPAHVFWSSDSSYTVTGRWLVDEDPEDIVKVLNPEDAPDAPVGIKHDTDKLKFSLLTHDLAEQVKEVVKVLTHGAKKYSPRGWQKLDNPIRRYTDALYRHLNKWHQGETHDPETGCHHLAHAVCNLMFMMYFSMTRLNKTED